MDPQYLLIQKPYGRVPPPQLPSCSPQPLLSLPTKVWAVTGSSKQPGSRLRTWVIFCLELNCLFDRTESTCCPEHRKERLSTGEGQSSAQCCWEFAETAFFLSAWQEAVTYFQDTFSHQPPFSYLVQLVGVFEVKSVNLGKIQTPLTTDIWSSITVQRLIGKSRYYIPHYSSLPWHRDPFMRAKVF